MNSNHFFFRSLFRLYFIVSPIFILAPCAEASDIIMKMTTTDGSTTVDFKNASDTSVGSVDSAGQLVVSSHVRTGGFLSLPELSAAGSASTDRARLYAKDVGGETFLAYIDSTGRERIIRSFRDIVVADSELVATNMGTTYKDVHYGVTASALSRVVVNFSGFTEARIMFAVDNNEADTIQCRIYNETTAAELTSATSDSSGTAQVVTGSWVSISLTGDNTIRADCREGTGATADPDIGVVHLQIR
jgi:hypothetical protein